MTQAPSTGSSPQAIAGDGHPTVWIPPRIVLSSVWTLFWLTLRQHGRARRLLVLGFLLLLPGLVAILARNAARPPRAGEIEFVTIFTLLSNALIPLTALLYASGMIQDEIEEQTLTYLLIRPLPKWTIYVAKLLATLLVTTLLAVMSTALTYVTIFWGTPEFTAEILSERIAKTCCLLALALAGYCAFFGCLSLLTRRTLVAGVSYIIIFEGVLANIDFVVRRATVMYYFRVLTERCLPSDPRFRHLDLSIAPGPWQCVGTLLAASFVLTALATFLFTTREFRLKTPEGS
jgi:ABC-2 type transport system permease protein